MIRDNFCIKEEESMNIFDVLPANFFNIFASKNKGLYSNCLKLIFDKTQSEVTFSYSRDQLVLDIVELLESQSHHEFDEIEDVTTKSYKDKANVIIRKLKECGWILEGLNTDYSKTVFFSNVALPFINAIDDIYENTRESVSFDEEPHYAYSTRVEIDGYAYSIYSLLKQNTKLKKSSVLLQVTENTKLMLNSLKQLNYKIKSYSDSVKALVSVDAAIKDFFTEYTSEVLYKNYHKIKTLDNVSKYRNQIITSLSGCLRSSNYIKEVSEELIQADHYENIDEASQKVREMILYSIDSIQNIDDIIKAIEEENYMYTNIILKKTKFMIENNDDVEGYLKQILKKVSDSYEDGMDISSLFNLYSVGYIDNESLYTPRKSRTVFKQQRLSVDMTDNIFDSPELLDKLKGSAHSMKSIDVKVREMLSEKSELTIDDIPLDTVLDFIQLIYIIIYAPKSKQYNVDYYDENVIINGVKFKKLVIRGA